MQLDWTILRSGEQIMYRLRGLYERYGYRRFKMSKFEEYDLYVRNKDFLVSDRMITFTDARGILMALKPDVTLSIIKNTRAEEAGPRKVYYNESVYRSGQGEETFQEIMQTGLECIGELDLYHIYEVIALAVESLRAIHPDYVLDVSHMGLVSGFMEAAGVTVAEYPEVMTAVRAKNLAGLEDFCRRRGLSGTVQALLERLVTTYGTMEAVLDHAKQEGVFPVCMFAAFCCDAMEMAYMRFAGEDAKLMHHMLLEEKRAVSESVSYAESCKKVTEFIRNALAYQEMDERNLSKGVAAAVDYGRHHYSEPISLESVSREVHLNTEYLSRIFKEETGCTYSTFLSETRLQKAAYLLSHTPERVQKIAESVGYPNVSYFSTTFKKRYGVNPYEYRRGEEKDAGNHGNV